MKTIEILREQGFVELNEYALNLYSVSDEAVIRIEDLFSHHLRCGRRCR